MGRRRETLDQFYRNERQALFTYALTLTGDPQTAEDLIHATFVVLLGRLILPRDLRPYAFRMMRNRAVDLRRRQIRHAESLPLLAPTNGALQPIDYARYRELEAALECLTEDERETVVLKAMNGMTFNEIAAIRNVSVNTAASWYRRGLVKLRQRLEETK